MGGNGDYVIEATDNEGRHRRAKFLSQSGEPIDIWISDQGCEVNEKYVCHDLEFVVRILKEFAETGKFETDLVWE